VRINVNNPLPSELASHGVSESFWSQALGDLDELNDKAWEAAASNVGLQPTLPLYSTNSTRAPRTRGRLLQSVSRRYVVVDKGAVSVQWIPWTIRHTGTPPGGLTCYKIVEN
jgi:hypothetical protein